ncbi:hypothetical protein OROGR_013557 [Orobanche gracilis]
MDRAVRGRRGRGRGAGRNPRPRANNRNNAIDQASSAGSDTANSAGESTRSPATRVSQSVNHNQDSVQQDDVHVNPLTIMQGMMAQMTQMANLMGTMQNQQAQPPPRQERCVSTIINDISRQRPPSFEGSSEPADVIHWLDHFEKLFTMVECPEGHKVSVAAYYLGKSAHSWWQSCKHTNGPINWDQFKARMLERYYPSPVREAKLADLLSPDPSTEEDILTTAEKFQELLLFASSIVRTEADKIKYFSKRLKL